MPKHEEIYGGLLLYEVSSKDIMQYIVSNPDQIRELLNHPDFDKTQVENSDQIVIRKLGRVLINPLTLDRLVTDHKSG